MQPRQQAAEIGGRRAETRLVKIDKNDPVTVEQGVLRVAVTVQQHRLLHHGRPGGERTAQPERPRRDVGSGQRDELGAVRDPGDPEPAERHEAP